MATDDKTTRQDTTKATQRDTDKTTKATETATSSPGERREVSAADYPGRDLKETLRASHERRTTVPGASNVDARLDNRTGRQRPKLETFPAKPQQIDGPDVMHQVEHTRRTLNQDPMGQDWDEVGDRKGMFSPGPHGLSDESLREGETSFGTEGLSVSEAAKGAPKAD